MSVGLPVFLGSLPFHECWKEPNGMMLLPRYTVEPFSDGLSDLFSLHVDEAVVASYGLIFHTKDGKLTAAFVLEPSDFNPYVRNHPWAFPAHWQCEMAAQVAGLRFYIEVLLRYPQYLDRLAEPFTRQTGVWKNGPLPVMAHTTHFRWSIMATAIDLQITPVPRMNLLKYSASVCLSSLQDDGKGGYKAISAECSGIEVAVSLALP